MTILISWTRISGSHGTCPSVSGLSSMVLEKEMAPHFSIPAWAIPWTEEPGGLQSTGSQRVRHGLTTERQPQFLGFTTLGMTLSKAWPLWASTSQVEGRREDDNPNPFQLRVQVPSHPSSYLGAHLIVQKVRGEISGGRVPTPHPSPPPRALRPDPCVAPGREELDGHSI